MAGIPGRSTRNKKIGWAAIIAAIVTIAVLSGYEVLQASTSSQEITSSITTYTTSISESTTQSLSTLTISNSTGKLSSSFSSTGTLTSVTTSSGTVPSPIQHVVVIMQENRPFDNFFWTWPGQMGYNANLCMPLNPNKPSAGCLTPQYSANPVVPHDLPHTWTASWNAYNNGSMNGFLSEAGDSPEVMTYYNATVLGNVWSLASHYTLADQWFTSAKSYSQPNHWYLLSGQAPAASLLENAQQEKSQCVSGNQLTLSTCAYINEAQPIQTMADELTEHGLSWKYYDAPLPKGYTLDQGILGCSNCNPWDYWSPLRAQNRTWTDPAHFNSMVARQQFLWDVGNGTLPDVSWVIPSAPISDHPPANITLGEWWIADVVDAVMNSQYWKNTLIVVLWDDYGGFYDTVVPPSVDPNGLSFRCPALIVSAYAKPDYLDHTVYSFESTLKFIEWNWNLPALTSRDANANNLLGALNFNQAPASPYTLPLTQTQLQTIAPYIVQGSSPNPNPGGNSTLSPLDGLAFINNDPD
jgi:phospholipase C